MPQLASEHEIRNTTIMQMEWIPLRFGSYPTQDANHIPVYPNLVSDNNDRDYCKLR